MNRKSVLSLVVATIILTTVGIICRVVIESVKHSKPVIEIKEDSVKANYEIGVNHLKKFFNENLPKNSSSIIDIFSRSVDSECAAQKVKQYNLRKAIHNHDDFIPLVSSMIECSQKIKFFSDFAFDVIMSSGRNFVKAFKDEPEMEEAMLILKCVVNFAYKKNMVPQSLTFPSYFEDIDSLEMDRCRRELNITIDAILEKSHQKIPVECLFPTKDMFNLIIKTAALTQFQLKSEEAQTEADNFFNELQKISKDSVVCGGLENLYKTFFCRELTQLT